MRGRITRIAPLLSVALGVALLAVVGVSLAANLSPQPKPTLPLVGCYLSFYEGELVNDSSLGPAIVTTNGQRQQVRWPGYWTVTRIGGEVVVTDRAGNLVVRTGTRVYLPGGTAPDGRWETCSGAKELP
jgi:hypothetical protein